MLTLSLEAAMLMMLKRRRANMTFQEAKYLAIEFGVKVPSCNRHPSVLQCWIDRIAMLPMAAVHASHHSEKQHRIQLADAIAEANRYA